MMETEPLRPEQLRSLSIIQRAVVSGLDEQAVLQLIADEACRLTQATQVAIFVLEGNMLRIVATSGESGPRSSIDVRIPLAGSLVEAAIVSGQVERLANAAEDTHVTADPRREALIESLGIHSLLLAPLVVEGRAIGAISASHHFPDRFDRRDEQMLTLIADQAALAVENARLRREVQQAAVREERSRLARELHDSVTQSLYSLTLFAEAARSMAERDGDSQLEERVARIGDIAQQALKEMRLLVFELRPSVLDSGGLISALRRRLEAVEGRAGVDARLVVEDLPSVSGDVEQELYRIAQEALNNSLKHAAATIITVTLRQEADCAVLEVADDGIGFEPSTAKDGGGMGLTSMRQRIEGVGGKLSVESKPGNGTCVTATVPVPRDVREEQEVSDA